MRFRWIALGVVGFAVWLIATFGVLYAAIELAEDNTTHAIVVDREKFGPGRTTTIRWCVTYNITGTVDEWCEVISGSQSIDPPACYLDAEIGKPLPSSCQFSD